MHRFCSCLPGLAHKTTKTTQHTTHHHVAEGTCPPNRRGGSRHSDARTHTFSMHNTHDTLLDADTHTHTLAAIMQKLAPTARITHTHTQHDTHAPYHPLRAPQEPLQPLQQER